ncbi:DUF520 family protein [Bacillus subtilis]|nr:DUF520 family protein [Bacillus subtilis]UVB76644.1 DUF520 family protein [Bacillus subtilis]
MAKESSFDIVSKVELPEVQNAIQIALKEISTRYDFKGSKSDISLDKEELVLVSDDEFKLSQLKDVLVSKLIKRNVPTKNTLSTARLKTRQAERCASAQSLFKALTRTTQKKSIRSSKTPD